MPAVDATPAADAASGDAAPVEGASVELVGGPLVAGGSSICRTDAGEVVFVPGALPGERIRVALGARRKGWRAADLVEVVDRSGDRVDPACPHVVEGCGGCDLAHAAPDAQPSLKAAVVSDALRRLGRIAEPVVEVGPSLPHDDYRTTVRALVVDGRAALRQRSSHDPVVLDRCLVAHPLVEELLIEGRFPGAREITVRAGAATGERLVVVAPSAVGAVVPAGTIVVGDDELRRGRHAALHEIVGGHPFRVSARSFFQSSRSGAEALVAEVRDAAGPALSSADRVLDAYCGVGLLGGLLLAGLAAGGARVPDLLGVESSGSSVRDARHNLGRLDLDCDIELERSRVEDLRDEPADLVVADPARTGLGRVAAARLAATGAHTIVLVSCDAASLGRDAGLLVDRGYRLERSRLVDLFPQTSHVEVVSRFVRGG